MADLKYYDVILKPVVTEKSMTAMGEKKYTFYVNPDATKTQIKEAVERMFEGAKVAKVNTMNLNGKKKRSPKILVARVEAILRRSNNLSAGEVLKAGGIELDIAAHEVRIDGKEVTLSFKEFELLNYFVVNQGVALSREKILNNVWNYDYFGDARTIDTHVKKLRSKLGEKGEYIKTIWGMGYKFEVD